MISLQMKTFVLLVVVSLLVSDVWTEDSIIVKTKSGAVKGIRQLSATGKGVDAWYGIPYAQPPIGDLRFRHPRPIDRWNGVKDATELPKCCHQIIDSFFGDFSGAQIWNAKTPMSEDCLTVNVVVPIPRPLNAVVLVWIHGGGFYSGASSLDVYDPKILVSEQNIIVVSIQYRLASLGFLYMGNTDVPGNAGLFDQSMALHWIHDNIQFFGGNKNNITLFGESAGASSVSMHLLSPLSQNTFSQAIMQSGSATGPSVMMTKEKNIHRGLRLAEAVGCPHDKEDIKPVIDCLKVANASQLVNNEYASGTLAVEFPFVAVLDGAFFSESPQESLNKGNFKKTKILMGSDTDEGNYFLLYFFPDIFLREENVRVSREDFLYTVKFIFSNYKDVILRSIEFQYTNWLKVDDGDVNREMIDRIIGDIHFTCPVNKFAYQYSLAGHDVFMYHYTHRSTQNVWPKWTGVMHGDEINFVFGEPLNPKFYYTEKEKELSKMIMTFWANFAKTGNPNISPDRGFQKTYWPFYTSKKREHLNLGTTMSTGNGHRTRECEFWDTYFPVLVNGTEKESTCSKSKAENGITCSINNVQEFSLSDMECKFN